MIVLTRLDKGVGEGSNTAIGVEGNVGNGVVELDAVVHLLEVGVLNDIGLVAGAEVHGVSRDTEALSHEGLGLVAGRDIRTLAESMVETIGTESLTSEWD